MSHQSKSTPLKIIMGKHGEKPFASSHNQKRVTTNLKSINNQKCQKIKLHGAPTPKELKKQSNRKTRPVRTCSEAADSVGRADWMRNSDSELTADYSGCHHGRNSQSHMRICWKVGYSQAGELYRSLYGPSPIGSTTAQQGGVPDQGEYLKPHPLTT